MIYHDHFSNRWHNDALSEYWYTDFADISTEDAWYQFTWLFAVPLFLFAMHTVSCTRQVDFHFTFMLGANSEMIQVRFL